MAWQSIVACNEITLEFVPNTIVEARGKNQSSSSTKASITRVGLSALTYSSILSGSKNVWVRIFSSTNRFIESPNSKDEQF